jgi:hypothetical protein
MKKLYILVIAVIAVFIVASFIYAAVTKNSGSSSGFGLAALSPGSCSDSDGGKDYAVKGTATKGTNSKTDSCSSASVLIEYFCNKNSISSINYNCGSGKVCSNGACIPSCTPATCTSLSKSCGSWSDGCYGNLSCGTCNAGYTCSSGTCVLNCNPATCTSLSKSCGSWSDGCYGNLSCGTCNSDYNCISGTCIAMNNSCSDSDYGINKTILGFTSGKFNNTAYRNDDSCSNNFTLIEYYCYGVKSYSNFINCNGNGTVSCLNGICI